MYFPVWQWWCVKYLNEKKIIFQMDKEKHALVHWHHFPRLEQIVQNVAIECLVTCRPWVVPTTKLHRNVDCITMQGKGVPASVHGRLPKSRPAKSLVFVMWLKINEHNFNYLV